MSYKPKNFDQYWALYDFIWHLYHLELISHNTRVWATQLIIYPD